MTRKEPRTRFDIGILGRQRNLNPFPQTRLRIFIFAAFMPLCLLLCANTTLAETKRHKSSKSTSRSHRAENKKRTNVKQTSKNESRRTRHSTQDRRTNVRRDLFTRREAANKRERATRSTTAPNVRKTVIVSSPQTNNKNAPREALVNDIVIISLAEETPVTSKLSSAPVVRPVGTSENMPSIWPVAGAIRGGFGMRSNPFGGRGIEFHKGQDIHALYGAPVIATADGMVVNAGWLRGYGQVVYVDHGNGISTRYGHLSRIDVTAGQMVKRGEQLGLVGSTGRSTGPHLHYEVRVDGQATNPIPYLPNTQTQPVTTSPVTR